MLGYRKVYIPVYLYIYTMTDKRNIISKIPKPKIQRIKLLSVDHIFIPHLYCITPRHLTGKSMYLNEETIRDAEKNNSAVCDICRRLVREGRQKNILPFDEHKKTLTLFVQVPDKQDLNSIPGLNEYLLKIKPVLLKLGIDGVAFKKEGAK